jgi:hypothetical protein
MARNVKFLTKDIKKALSKGGKIASVQIMRSLSQKGPYFTGSFSSSWYSYDPKKKKAGKARQQVGSRYLYKDTDVKGTVIPVRLNKMLNELTLYTIENTSNYAEQALDLTAYIKRPPFPDTGPDYGEGFFKVGIREDGAKRGNVKPLSTGDGSNTSTAPLDWWTTYASSELQKDSKIGFRAGIKLVSKNPTVKL